MTGRYVLNWADRAGVESTALHHDSGEVLLELRDERLREPDPSAIYWRVLDSEDHGGEVEWCRGCGLRAVLYPRDCDRCRLDHEIAQGEPYGVVIEWPWPKRRPPISRRRPFDIGEHLHLL